MDANALQALMLAFLAGMSTLLGAVVVLFSKRSVKLITVSLGFAAGIMIAVSLLELFPLSLDAFVPVYGKIGGTLFAVLFLLIGMVLSVLLDKILPEPKLSVDEVKTGEQSHLFRTGLYAMLALGLHNIPEGMATFIAGCEDTALGITITLAIAFHNIPEGIAVAMPVWYSTANRWKAVWYTAVSGAAEPIGALLACLLLRPFLTDALLGALFSLVAGIMVYIAIEELLPSSRKYGYDDWALIATMIGVSLMPLTGIFR